MRLNTDRPETIFDARGNLLIPPINRKWMTEIVSMIYEKRENYGYNFNNKKQIYGIPGGVSQKIVRILKKEFENDENNFFPWLHQRLGFWSEGNDFEYL
jgi:UDP-N-acetylglucosamine 2-epimerase (non-hydrolysing)